jgi:hypothetical protein
MGVRRGSMAMLAVHATCIWKLVTQLRIYCCRRWPSDWEPCPSERFMMLKSRRYSGCRRKSSRSISCRRGTLARDHADGLEPGLKTLGACLSNHIIGVDPA